MESQMTDDATNAKFHTTFFGDSNNFFCFILSVEECWEIAATE